MNLNTFKNELKSYLEDKNISYNSDLLTFSLFEFLKNSNFKNLFKDIKVYQNEGKVTLSWTKDEHFYYSDKLDSFDRVKPYNSNDIFKNQDLYFLNYLKNVLQSEDYKTFINFCKDDILKITDIEESIHSYHKKFFNNDLLENLIYLMKQLNENVEEKNFEDYTSILFETFSNNNKKILKNMISLHFTDRFLKNNSTNLTSESIDYFLLYHFEDTNIHLKDNFSIDDINILLDDNDYLKLLLNSNTKEEFIDKSFPILIKDIENKFSKNIDLLIKRIKTEENLYLDVEEFNNIIKQKYAYMFEKEKIHEFMYINESYVEFNKNKFGLSLYNLGYTILKTKIIEDENITFNYETDCFPVMQIYSSFEDYNGCKIICPNNFIYLNDKELLKESFDKYFEYCLANNYIVNPTYKVRMNSDKLFIEAFNESLAKYPELIVAHHSNDFNNILKIIKEKSLNVKEINQLRTKIDLTNEEEVAKILLSSDKSFLYKIKNY